MQFAGFWRLLYAKYRCPHCGADRYFRSHFWDNSLVELTRDDVVAETPRVVKGVVTIVLAFLVIGFYSDYSRDRKKAEASAAKKTQEKDKEGAEALLAAFVTAQSEYVSIALERTLINNSSHELFLLIAVRPRAGTKATPEGTSFFPMAGYVLGTDGTRYDVRQKSLEKGFLDRTSPVTIVPGETYRYYLATTVPPSPVTGDAPLTRIRGAVLHLPDNRSLKLPEPVAVER